MSKFWQKKYTSKYTGAEIDAAVAKAGDATKVTANPTLAGTESALTGIEVGETKYKLEQPINVVANPTLAGTEAALAGLQVGDTKYKVDVGTSIPIIPFPVLGTSDGIALMAAVTGASTTFKMTSINTTNATSVSAIQDCLNAITDLAILDLSALVSGAHALAVKSGTSISTSIMTSNETNVWFAFGGSESAAFINVYTYKATT